MTRLTNLIKEALRTPPPRLNTDKLSKEEFEHLMTITGKRPMSVDKILDLLLKDDAPISLDVAIKLEPQLKLKQDIREVQDWEEEGDWEDDDNIYTGPYSYGIDKRTWDNDWRLPKDNLFNSSKTINATNNRMDSIRKMLKNYPKELAKFENNPDYPAFNMTYDELVKWYKSISNFDLSESVKKKDCNCGCNTCENVGNEGVLLNESITTKYVLSGDLQYHVKNKLPLSDSTLPHDSQKYIDLINESKYLYVREIIHLSNKDIQYLYPNKK